MAETKNKGKQNKLSEEEKREIDKAARELFEEIFPLIAAYRKLKEGNESLKSKKQDVHLRRK